MPNSPINIVTASSTPMTLQIMSVAALIFVPIVLAYQAWSIGLPQADQHEEHPDDAPALAKA